MKKGKDVTHYCDNCQRYTNQEVRYVELAHDPDLDVSMEFALVQCKGCNSICYRTEVTRFDEYYEDEDGNLRTDPHIFNFPVILENHVAINDYSIPRFIRKIYNQSIGAFANDYYLLAGAGFRAVIEAICKQHKIKGKDLAAQIGNMAKAKLITEKEADRMHSIRFLGNDSIHEMLEPSSSSLRLVLDIIDHLLNNLYVIDRRLLLDKLDKVIPNYRVFELLLIRSLYENSDMTSVKTITGFLGKSARRLVDKGNDYEKALKEKIINGEFPYLKVGPIPGKNEHQTYEVIKKPTDNEAVEAAEKLEDELERPLSTAPGT